MTHTHPSSSRSLLRRYLVAGYVAFIVYASLSPFWGWQEQGLAFFEVLVAPFGQTYTAFDALINLLAYLPFGILVGLNLRTVLDAKRSVLFSILCGLLLSTAMEYLQMYLPKRISSNSDILSDVLGTGIGSVLAVSMVRQEWFARITAMRIGLVRKGSSVDFGLALALLWIFAQVNPTLPMLGSVFITVPFYGSIVELPEASFNALESMAVALNLVLEGLLLLTLLRERRHAVIGLVLVLCLVALAKFVAAATLLKSWALLLWLNSGSMLGIVVGLLLIMGMGRLSRTWQLRALALAAISYLLLVNWVLDSGMPSAAMQLYHWHYGHLRNYNGLSQTVSSLFPLLLGGYLWWARARGHQEEGNK